jgi:shikimate kinase
MGAGKSSVGRCLQRQLQLPRFDTDELLAAKFGKPVGEVLRDLGEQQFRDAETAVLRELRIDEIAIVVTGGGIVLRDENVALLRALGTTVWLTADEETLYRRVSKRATRPLLQTADPRSTISEMLRTREPLYAAAADVVIDTSNRSHEEVAADILAKTADL